MTGTSSAASAQASGKPGSASSHFNTGSSTIHNPGTTSPPLATPVPPAVPAPVPPPPVARPHPAHPPS
jgi:hypothetical protein